MLADGDGFTFCKEFRHKTATHILFLTAKTEHEDMVRGLCDGGDDYITKPYHPKELLARVDAVMRRRKMTPTTDIITKGTLTLNITTATAFVAGIALLLTPKEFSLLLFLSQNEDKLICTEDLYKRIWNAPLSGDKNALQTAISKLRGKLTSTGYTVTKKLCQSYIFEKI